MMQMVRSLLFGLLMFGSVAPYSIALLLVAPFGYDRCYNIAVVWARLIQRGAKLFCGLDYRVVGKEHIPAGAAVYMLKHSSAFETILELLIFPRQTWVLKRELTLIPIFGWALHYLRPIAIDRRRGRNAVRSVVEQGKQALTDGTNVMIFPEGTRVQHGLTRKYGLSGFVLAGEAGVTIVPVAHDAGRFWPRRGIHKKPGTVSFIIGEPIVMGAREPRAVAREVQTWIEEQLRELDAGTHPALASDVEV
ncbi:MAG: lysophospholipid acyltransferase family protein [Pseudomonadota bacterium]